MGMDFESYTVLEVDRAMLGERIPESTALIDKVEDFRYQRTEGDISSQYFMDAHVADFIAGDPDEIRARIANTNAVSQYGKDMLSEWADLSDKVFDLTGYYLNYDTYGNYFAHGEDEFDSCVRISLPVSFSDWIMTNAADLQKLQTLLNVSVENYESIM